MAMLIGVDGLTDMDGRYFKALRVVAVAGLEKFCN